MKSQLKTHVSLLVVYFNVMILSKAFKPNKTLTNLHHPTESFHGSFKLATGSNTAPGTFEANGDIDEASTRDEMAEEKSFSRQASYRSSMNHANKTTTTTAQHSVTNTTTHRSEYDADGELSFNDDMDDDWTTSGGGGGGQNVHKYDLILFPKILELCLSFILGVKKKQYDELKECREVINRRNEEAAANIETSDCVLEAFAKKYASFDRVTHAFLKRLIYLLETCNYNVQIIIYNNYRQHFIDLLAKKPESMLNATRKSLDKVFILLLSEIY